MIVRALIALASTGLTLYFLFYSSPKKACPGGYMLYVALMSVVGAFNMFLGRLLLSGLTPSVEEAYKIAGAKFTPAKNPYVLSGVIFALVELATYVIMTPTLSMLVSRSMVLFLHPFTMLVFSIFKKKVNTLSGFFVAASLHSTWNILMITYPQHFILISLTFLASAIIMTMLFRGNRKITFQGVCPVC